MLRLGTLILLVVLTGCSQQRQPESPDLALRHAAALWDAGDFKGADAVLQAALGAPELAAADRREMERQDDLLRRIKMDYSLSREHLFRGLSNSVRNLTPQEFEGWVRSGRFDGREIDGEMRFVGTSQNNLFFRNPELRERRMGGRNDVPEQKGRLLLSQAIKKAAREQHTPCVLPHYLLCSLSVIADKSAAPPGELIRAWLPVPRYYPYQNQIKLIASSPPMQKLAPENSPIRSAYFEQTARSGQPTIFSVAYSYARYGVYFDMDPSQVKPADLSNPVLKKFTSESPHVVFTPEIKELSARLAGAETNPYVVAKALYDWIGANIKYSYAREYSTLTNLSDYCLRNHYGDCGQEAMLFIALCRSRNIPARWQTGWDLYPGYHDIHDWTEIYLAPYGWVPVDPWAGLFATQYCPSLTPAQRSELHDFYFGGLDCYRMAANGDHSQTLDPPKQGLRSDDVDFQRGELEWGQHDIYFDDYSYTMNVQEFGCPPFAADQILSFPKLVNQLSRQTDPVSAFLWQQLSSDEQSILLNPDATGAGLGRAQQAVIRGLNKVITLGEPCIFDSQRFQGIVLRPRTAQLLESHPGGIELSRLNRLLLEDAYPTELTRSEP
jgi:transglutaminase-like putative cysteine protease